MFHSQELAWSICYLTLNLAEEVSASSHCNTLILLEVLWFLLLVPTLVPTFGEGCPETPENREGRIELQVIVIYGIYLIYLRE